MTPGKPVGPDFNANLDWIYRARVHLMVPMEPEGNCTIFCDLETFPTAEKFQEIVKTLVFKVAVGNLSQTYRQGG